MLTSRPSDVTASSGYDAARLAARRAATRATTSRPSSAGPSRGGPEVAQQHPDDREQERVEQRRRNRSLTIHSVRTKPSTGLARQLLDDQHRVAEQDAVAPARARTRRPAIAVDARAVGAAEVGEDERPAAGLEPARGGARRGRRRGRGRCRRDGPSVSGVPSTSIVRSVPSRATTRRTARVGIGAGRRKTSVCGAVAADAAGRRLGIRRGRRVRRTGDRPRPRRRRGSRRVGRDGGLTADRPAARRCAGAAARRCAGDRGHVGTGAARGAGGERSRRGTGTSGTAWPRREARGVAPRRPGSARRRRPRHGPLDGRVRDQRRRSGRPGQVVAVGAGERRARRRPGGRRAPRVRRPRRPARARSAGGGGRDSAPGRRSAIPWRDPGALHRALDAPLELHGLERAPGTAVRSSARRPVRRAVRGRRGLAIARATVPEARRIRPAGTGRTSPDVAVPRSSDALARLAYTLALPEG